MGANNEELLKNIRYYQDSLDKYSSIGNNYKVRSYILLVLLHFEDINYF